VGRKNSHTTRTDERGSRQWTELLDVKLPTRGPSIY
jgi:hypothetical protein